MFPLIAVTGGSVSALGPGMGDPIQFLPHLLYPCLGVRSYGLQDTLRPSLSWLVPPLPQSQSPPLAPRARARLQVFYLGEMILGWADWKEWDRRGETSP